MCYLLMNMCDKGLLGAHYGYVGLVIKGLGDLLRDPFRLARQKDAIFMPIAFLAGFQKRPSP